MKQPAWIRMLPRKCPALLLMFLLLSPPRARSYSVLTHEEIVDLLWIDNIQPALVERFPGTTAEQLKEAHAYAYGGAVIQDLGYYPFGDKYFSDLVHYVRSGDLVANMLKDAQDVDEYAFAIGALAHYVSDICGHPAVNRAVAIEFPKLERKYGPVITYEQDKAAHLNTEFGFDVLQVAKQRYAFDSYHSFIGFQVSKPLLERAFQETYGVPLKTVLSKEDLAIGTYRWSISKVIPEMTKVALATREKQIMKEYPDTSRAKFLYHISRADYQREYGKEYVRPGIGARILAVLLRLVPKIGPLKALKYKDPTPKTEDMYFKSVDATVDMYRGLLRQLKQNQHAKLKLPNENLELPGLKLKLPNQDLDTGKAAQAGEYALSDDTVARLTLDLAKNQFNGTPEDLRAFLIRYYASAKQDKLEHEDKGRKWQQSMAAVEALKQGAPSR